MASLSVSLYPRSDAGVTRWYVTCHGFAGGHYGDLWALDGELPGVASTAAQALEQLGELLCRLASPG